MRQFFYTPFMHSENMEDQNRAVELYQRLPGEDADKWARHHRGIIEQFGRFPHRNAILGRDSTDEEKAWLRRGRLQGLMPPSAGLKTIARPLGRCQPPRGLPASESGPEAPVRARRHCRSRARSVARSAGGRRNSIFCPTDSDSRLGSA